MTVDPSQLNSAGFTAPNGLSQALWSAPDLWNTPSLAVTAATTAQPDVTAQGLAHLNQAAAVQAVAQHHTSTGGHGFWGSIAHAITGAVAPVLNLMNKPLKDIQHQYRYLKDVYHRHGFWAGFGETMAITGAGIAGTIGGSLIGNPELGLVAAEATSTALSHNLYQDSWQASQNEGGSIGRDLAHLLGQQNTQSGWGKVISGLGDAGFDVLADPLRIGGKLSSIRRGAEGLDRPTVTSRVLHLENVRQNSAAVGGFVSRFGPGTAIRSTDQIDDAYRAYGGYRRALNHIATLDEGGVVAHYPELQNLAPEFAQANTAAKVHQVFRQAANDAEWQGRLQSGQLPSRSVMRVGATRVLDKLRGDIQRQDELPLIAGRKTVMDNAGNTQSSLQLGALFRPTPANLQRALSRKVRTFSGYAPYGIDDATGDITGEFSYMKDDNLQGLLRSMQFSLGNKTARKRLGEYINAKTPEGIPDLGQRKQIWGEIQGEILKAAGMPDDPEAFALLVKKGRQVAPGAMHTTAYGFGHNMGDDVNAVRGVDSTQRLALWNHQSDVMGSFPDFRELRTAMRSMNRYTNLYGKVDDFAALHYTDRYFKPMALLTLGFGLRIAASEGIPAIMRNGAMNMLKARVAATAAKQGYRLANGEDGHILAAAARLTGGVDRLINNPDARDLALRTVIANNGQITHGVAAAGHSGFSVPDDPNQAAAYGVDQAIKRNGRVFYKPSEDFALFSPEDRQYVDMWHYGLVRRTKEKSAQLIAQDARAGGATDEAWQNAAHREARRVAGLHPDTGMPFKNGEDPYAFERQKLARYTGQDPTEFAAARVDDLRNYVTGRDGTVHNALLDKVINGDNNININSLRKIEPLSRPKALAGQVPEPFLGPNVLQNAITQGFKRTVDPVINYLSREPIYFNELSKQWKPLQAAVERGVLTEDSAFRIAQQRAVRGILPQIHNTHLRTQFSIMARNLMPFYFAQEQAMKRAGHLIIRNPAAFREYQLMAHTLNDSNFVHTDDQGNRTLMIPVIGEAGKMAMGAFTGFGLFGQIQTGLPLTVTGDMQSLRTVLPEAQLPSTSPFVALALGKLAALDPALAPTIKGVLGDRGYNANVLSALIPNTPLRTAVKGLMASEGDTSYANAMMSAMQSAAYHGQLPGPDATPGEQQAFIDRIKNNARSTLFLKAIVSVFSPLTPTVEQTDYGLRDEFYKLVKSKGSYEAALQAFIKEHGDRAVSYTVARSESATGANIPVAKDAVNFITANPALIAEHPWGAAFVTPQETTGKGDAQVLYSELLRSHLRERDTPQEFLNSMYSMTGVQQWVAANKAHKAALAALASNPAAQDAERQNFGLWQNEDFRLSNPIAYDYLFGPQKTTNAIQAYQDIVAMYNAGQAPNTPQADLLRGLLNDYERHREALAQMPGTDRASGHARQVERDNWSNYLDQTATSNPLLASVINAVFARLGALE